MLQVQAQPLEAIRGRVLVCLVAHNHANSRSKEDKASHNIYFGCYTENLRRSKVHALQTSTEMSHERENLTNLLVAEKQSLKMSFCQQNRNST